MKRIVSVAIAVAMMLVATDSGFNQASAVPSRAIPDGTPMVSTLNGLVQEWDTDTTPPTFLGFLDTTRGADGTIGSVFDAAVNFFIADFSTNAGAKFDPMGGLIGDFGRDYNLYPESDIMVAVGDLFVEHAKSASRVLSERLLASTDAMSSRRAAHQGGGPRYTHLLHLATTSAILRGGRQVHRG